jgi:glutamine synthetase
MNELAVDDLAGEYDTVVVATPDVQGRLLGRRLTLDAFRRGADRGVDMCTAAFAWDIVQNPMGMVGTLDWAGFHTGWPDIRLVADLSTLRPAGWLERTAICLADAVEPADGSPVAVAPRSILRRQVDALAVDGVRALTGTELEFYVYLGTPDENRAAGHADLRPTTLQPADYAIGQGDRYEGLFGDLRSRLAVTGIEAEAHQGEWGLGQWEMTLRCEDPMTMADHHALYKLAVRHVAAAHGLTATFMARPHSDQPGSSGHVHLSLWRDDEAAFTDESLLRAALGGAIEHTGDLLAWYAPTVNSYKRLAQQDFAGWGLTWGEDNRTTSFRVVGHHPDERRFEFRLPGADVNPHLALAGLLASVRDGVARRTDPGEPVAGNAYEEVPDAGLPRHLGEAAERFAASSWLRDTFGDGVVDHYAAHARAEAAAWLTAVTDWERERYLDLV